MMNTVNMYEIDMTYSIICRFFASIRFSLIANTKESEKRLPAKSQQMTEDASA